MTNPIKSNLTPVEGSSCGGCEPEDNGTSGSLPNCDSSSSLDGFIFQHNVNVDSGLKALEVPRLDRLLRLLRGQDPRTGLDISSYSLRLRIKWYLEQELRFHPRISKMPYIRNLDLPRSGVGSLLPHKIPHTDWEARGDELETLSQDYQDKVTLIQSERHYRDLLERWPRNAERGLSVPKSDEESVSFASWLAQLRIEGKSLSMDSLDGKISEPIVNVDSGLKALEVPRFVRGWFVPVGFWLPIQIKLNQGYSIQDIQYNWPLFLQLGVVFSLLFLCLHLCGWVLIDMYKFNLNESNPKKNGGKNS